MPEEFENPGLSFLSGWKTKLELFENQGFTIIM